MCLHPPQAYHLGRFIGRYGSSAETATFVATHSSQILRGVIQTAQDIQIVRLTRRGSKFSAHLVPAQILADAVAKPTVRAESILDGIFAQSVVIVEADGDRLVYQTTWETLGAELSLDIHFAAVGGTGGIADTCRLYTTLRIPTAVIADLDIIADRNKLRRILEVMTTPEAAEALVAEATLIMDSIRTLHPEIEPQEVAKTLNAILARPMDWAKNHDAQIRQELNRMAELLNRLRKLKHGGISSLPNGISEPLARLVSALNEVGLFLVPVGELEEWLADAEIDESKSNKWAWANAASVHIKLNGPQTGDIWDFVKSVGAYLSRT